MTYYIYIKDDKLNGAGVCESLESENITVEHELYNDYLEHPLKYTWEYKEIEVETPVFEEKEVEKEIEVPEYETVITPQEIIDYYDENDNPVYKTVETEEKIEVGSHTETIKEIEKVQTGVKTENKTVKVIVLNPNYEQDEIEQRKEQFNKEFFNTSLGYIRRLVTMKDGSKKDFLTDLLPTMAIGVQAGLDVYVIAYNEPDFTQEVINWEELQHVEKANMQFIQECMTQLNNDFRV